MKKIARFIQHDLKKLENVIELLQLGKPLPEKFRNHSLTGKLSNFQECHVQPNWLLAYKKLDDILVLELITTGSHSELF